MGTVHGEDLPYVFGAPLVEGFSHFPRNYTKSEVALSEAIMIFWSNFARTGNPNEHHRQDPVLLASKERNRFRSIVWDEYDSLHQKYLEIGKCDKIDHGHAIYYQFDDIGNVVCLLNFSLVMRNNKHRIRNIYLIGILKFLQAWNHASKIIFVLINYQFGYV